MKKVGALGLALVCVLVSVSAWAAETALPRRLSGLGLPYTLALGADARAIATIGATAKKEGQIVTIHRPGGRSIAVFLDKGGNRIVKIVVSLTRVEYERLSSQLGGRFASAVQYARENLGAHQSHVWQDRRTILKLVARPGKRQVELIDIDR